MESSSDDEGEEGSLGLPIDTEQANWNYDQAGGLVQEEEDQISLHVYSHLLQDKIHLMIQEVLIEVKLPYNPTDFQLLSLHVLGHRKNLFLISPTGSGKTLVIYLGILLLRKITGIR